MGKRGDKRNIIVIRNPAKYVRSNECSDNYGLNCHYPGKQMRSVSPHKRDVCRSDQLCCSKSRCHVTAPTPAAGQYRRRSSSSSDGRLRSNNSPTRSPKRRTNIDIKSGCSTCSSCDTCSLSEYSSSESCYSTESDRVPSADSIRMGGGLNRGHKTRLQKDYRQTSDAYVADKEVKVDSNRSDVSRAPKPPPRRARSFNEFPLYKDNYSTSADICRSDKSPIRNGRYRQDGHLMKDSRVPKSASPVGAKGARTTETSSGIGTSISGGVSSQKLNGPRKEPKQAARKQTELISKMASQTEHHRKQIKTLKTELEQLRTTSDSLAMCEVNQKDVEWRPTNVVGEGSFSTVYKGVFFGTEVAIKELRFKLSQDDKNYFRSEAALLQQLHHPRVVLLMGVCTSAVRPYMILEYLSGGTLHTLVHFTLKGLLDHAAYFSIAKDIAQGMTFLHKHEPQVLHLDLKSMNVLLDSYSRAKIADFGFSILRRRQRNYPPQREAIRGTPAYMAPELLTKGDVSAKCDVYSYAIVLWEMLTGTLPFQGLDVFQIMENIENGARPPLPRSNISQELRELIISCWAQSQTLRPNFEEILGALENASLPVAWRNVLHKANISPSMFSDWKTARKIINMIESSADFLEDDHISSNRAHDSRHTVSSKFQDNRLDPHRRNRSSSPIKRRSPTKYTEPLRHDRTRRSLKNYSLYTDRDVRDQKYTSAVRTSSPSKRRYSESSDLRHYRGDDSATHQSCRRQPRTRSEQYPARRWQESRIGRRAQRTYSDDSDTPYGSELEDGKRYAFREPHRNERTSYPRDSQPLLLQKSPKRYGSPERLGREQAAHRPRGYKGNSAGEKSPAKRNAAKKADGIAPYGGIALTAEQLLSQKQRLRPVRPSQLRELPQNSLNNISLILKQAIDQRRHAVDHPCSRNTGDFTDWF